MFINLLLILTPIFVIFQVIAGIELDKVCEAVCGKVWKISAAATLRPERYPFNLFAIDPSQFNYHAEFSPMMEDGFVDIKMEISCLNESFSQKSNKTSYDVVVVQIVNKSPTTVKLERETPIFDKRKQKCYLEFSPEIQFVLSGNYWFMLGHVEINNAKHFDYILMTDPDFKDKDDVLHTFDMVEETYVKPVNGVIASRDPLMRDLKRTYGRYCKENTPEVESCLKFKESPKKPSKTTKRVASKDFIKLPSSSVWRMHNYENYTETYDQIFEQIWKVLASTGTDQGQFPLDIFQINPIKYNYFARLRLVNGMVPQSYFLQYFDRTELAITCLEDNSKILFNYSSDPYKFDIKTEDESFAIDFSQNVNDANGKVCKIFPIINMDYVITDHYFFIIGWKKIQRRFKFSVILFAEPDFTDFDDVLRTYEKIEKDYVKPMDGFIASGDTLMERIKQGMHEQYCKEKNEQVSSCITNKWKFDYTDPYFLIIMSGAILLFLIILVVIGVVSYFK